MGTDVHSIFQKRTPGGWVDIESQYNEDRHYALFAWIGNVRNGFGFAGIPTHNRIEPLSDNRGLPGDFIVVDGEDHPIQSNAMRGRSAEWYAEDDEKDPSNITKWMGDYSHSWLLADEILNATPPRMLRTGIVGIDFFKKWDEVSAPESWCGGMSGPGVVVADSPSDITDKTTAVRIEWFEDTKESFAYFTDEVKRLKELHGDVRFVFGFDS